MRNVPQQVNQIMTEVKRFVERSLDDASTIEFSEV